MFGIRLLILVPAAIAAGALAAGCGTDDDVDGGGLGGAITTSSLGKAQFVKQANVACESAQGKGAAKLAAFEKDNPSGELPDEVWYAKLTKTVVLPTIETEIAEIRDLGAPAGDEERIEAFLDAEQEAIDAIAKRRRLSSFLDAEKRFAPSGKLARSYGLASCAHGGSFEAPADNGS